MQKGKPVKEYFMSEISMFYLFVTKNGGFEQFKREADTNHNETVQFNELYKYIESKSELKNISSDGRYRIWGDLDKFINGSNTDSTDGVSEDGSLSGTEEEQFEFRVEVYGKMSAKICSVIGEITGNSAFANYSINENSLEAEIIDEILASCGNKIERVPSYLNSSQAINDIRKYAVQGALFMVADQIYDNMGSFIQGYDNYDFESDNDLKSLVSNYIRTQNTTQGVDFGAVINNITSIVGKYLQTAGLAAGQTYNTPDGYEYQGKMNTLQLSVLEKNWRNAIANDPNADEYEGFAEELYHNAIDTFIGKQVAVWTDANSTTFNTYNISAGSIQQRFRNSEEMNMLSKVIELGGIEDDVIGYEGEWSDFYGTDDEPERMASVLFYFAGLNIFSNSEFAQMFGGQTPGEYIAGGADGADSVYMKYLKLAFTDILNNLEEYGIENPTECTQKDLQNAILRYFKDHIRDILGEMGITDESTIINALYMNMFGTYDIIHNNKTEAYGDYDISDLVRQAQEIISFAELRFGVPSSVIADCGLDDLDGLDAEELIQGMRELMEYLRIGVDGYNRIDPTQAAAVIEELVHEMAYADGVSNNQTVYVWLHKIAENYFDNFDGYSIKAFRNGLNNELQTWFANPIYMLDKGIGELESFEGLSEASSMEELHQALVDMINYASIMNVRIMSFFNGGTLNAAAIEAKCETEEELYNLIMAIKDTINGIQCSDMDDLANKYNDGVIGIYVSYDGTIVSTSSSPKIDMSDIDTDTGIPDGTTNFDSLGNARARIGRHLAPRVYEKVQTLMNSLGIPKEDWESTIIGPGEYDSNGNTTYFEQCLRNAVDNHWHWPGIFHTSYVVACEEAASECIVTMESWINNWLKNYLT